MKINAFYHMNDGLCRKYIVDTCHRQWSDLLIDTFTNEKNISKKITEVFDDIKDNNKIVQLILASIINNIVPLNLDYNDILNVLEISRLSIKVTQDENINTFIQIKDGCIQLKSSLLAVYMIRTLDLYDELLTVMEKMIRTSDKLHSNSTENIKRQLISTSNICEMFYKYETDFKSYDKILTFFSNIQEMNYYEDNEYFWLQYAMVCLDAASIDNNFYIRAENYFKTSYDILKRKKMDTYQTDVQYSRFLLERRMSGFADMDSPYETIVQAYNKLVNSYKSSRSEDYYIFKQIPLYKSFTEKFCERLSFKDCESLDKLFDKFIRLIRCNIKKRSTGSTEAEKVIEILSECKMILVRQQIACNIQI